MLSVTYKPFILCWDNLNVVMFTVIMLSVVVPICDVIGGKRLKRAHLQKTMLKQ